MLFGDWCDEAAHDVGAHALSLLTSRPADLDEARDALAAVVPTHYASEERMADLLQKLGKSASAEFIRNALPEGKRIRSGDLGEILANEYADESTVYALPIKRLRWKDHREMAMRGDDIIAVRESDDGQRLEFMKGKSKSRASLNAGVIDEARSSLDRDGGLPSPHALTFVATRLREIGEIGLADKIDEAQYKNGILVNQVCHFLFVFCGNSPENLLRTNLNAYGGTFKQHYAGLRVPTHQAFIKAVYLKVIENANNT